jgi:CheY-like chemotaxis protein
MNNTTQQGKNHQSPANQGGRILLMDDEEMIRQFVKVALIGAGYEVETAERGEEAIHLYREAKERGKPFDVVILDLMIPDGMGGQEMIAELLKIDPQVKAILSSGSTNNPVIANYRDYGFLEVLEKPYSLDQLKEMLQQLIG